MNNCSFNKKMKWGRTNLELRNMLDFGSNSGMTRSRLHPPEAHFDAARGADGVRKKFDGGELGG